MSAFALRGIPAERVRLLVPVALAGAMAGVVAGIVAGVSGVGLVAVGGVVALSLLLEVRLPWGGAVPLGNAVVIALAVILTPADLAVVMSFGLVLTWLGQQRRTGPARAAVFVLWVAASAAAASATSAATARIVDHVGVLTNASQARIVLFNVILAGAAYLAVDLVGRGGVLAGRTDRLRSREALPVYVALVCAAALLAIAYRQRGWPTALVAAVPLLITRFSFERYSSARQTYRQTIRALSMVPEVAGLTPLGHGERTAVYAAAIAESIGLDPEVVDRVITAARLHHIGHISLHEPSERHAPPDPVELGRVGGEILRETGFLADVAEMVESVHGGSGEGAPLPAAIVRVASTFDDLVGDDPSRAGDALVEVLTRHNDGLERSVAIVLIQLCDGNPELVEEARTSGAPLTSVVHHDDHEHEDHSYCV
ncbi:MAG: hypothetical protein QOG03_2312 [Actinomycetota bacterium]|jgi:hypothetical protein|nr:hypothetical protein [Actinomycetota bacterium]